MLAARRRHDRVRPPLPPRPAARPVAPAPARPAAAADADGGAGAPPRGLRPADRGEARARDRAGDRPRLRRAGADAGGDRRAARRRSSAGSASRPHRASTLVRVCRTIDLEGLRAQPIEAVEARLLRERGLGPWSLGVVALEGLGSWRHGLVGDLGLVKLCSALRGRWVELHETAELLEPYGEWAGLAGAYLMAGWSRGLVPGASADRAHFRSLARVRNRIAVVKLGDNSKIDLIKGVPLFSAASKARAGRDRGDRGRGRPARGQDADQGGRQRPRVLRPDRRHRGRHAGRQEDREDRWARATSSARSR